MLRLKKVSGRKAWYVLDGRKIVAKLSMDHHFQVEAVTLHTKDEAQQMQIKHLALSHIQQFVRHRDYGNLLFTVEQRNHHLTEPDSDELMNFGRIPEEIVKMSTKDADTALAAFATVVVAAYTSTEEMIQNAVNRVNAKTNTGVTFAVLPSSGYGQMFTFGIRGPRRFTFWTNLHAGDTDPLYIIPAYHPCRNGGRQIELINGDTSAVIRASDNGIGSLPCPADSSRGKNLFGGWETMHPYCASGKEFALEIREPQSFAAKAADAIEALLLGALQHENTYIAVSGGFRAPGLTHPHNVANGRYYRGSEADCVWQYLTLKEEGKLDGAVIPEWFFKEKWLEAYGYKAEAASSPDTPA